MEKKTLKRKYKTMAVKNTEIEILKASAKRSSTLAVRESRALGLTIKLIINNNLVEKLPSGQINIIRNLKVPSKKNGLKKGDVLCRKK